MIMVRFQYTRKQELFSESVAKLFEEDMKGLTS